MPARSRPMVLGGALAGLLLLGGCGASEPAPLKPMDSGIPADLCASLPEATRTGLVAASDTDQTGTPTAACSLTSPDGAARQVRVVVTWTQLDSESTASDVLASQCRAIDPAEYAVQQTYTVTGARKACAGRATQGDSATIAAATSREVLTARVTATPAGTPDALVRGTQMLAGVIASMGTDSSGS